MIYANLAVALLGIQGDTLVERSRRITEISTLLDLIERVVMTAKQANALANGLRGLPQMLREAKETKLADKMERCSENYAHKRTVHNQTPCFNHSGPATAGFSFL